MKTAMKYFRALGDAFGLAILLGGLLLATNNFAGERKAARTRRAVSVKAASAAREARAAA